MEQPLTWGRIAPSRRSLRFDTSNAFLTIAGSLLLRRARGHSYPVVHHAFAVQLQRISQYWTVRHTLSVQYGGVSLKMKFFSSKVGCSRRSIRGSFSESVKKLRPKLWDSSPLSRKYQRRLLRISQFGLRTICVCNSFQYLSIISHYSSLRHSSTRCSGQSLPKILSRAIMRASGLMLSTACQGA